MPHPSAPPLQIASLLRLSPAAAETIRAVDPRITLHVLSDAAIAWLSDPRRDVPGSDAVRAEVDAVLPRCEVWFGFPRERLPFERADALRWLQLASAGADRVLQLDLPPRVTITNVSGLHATPIGEWVLAFLLMHAKQMPLALDHQRQATWKRYSVTNLRDATVGIVGLGAIGEEIARLCKAFGARVIATRRSARPGETAPNVDALFPLADLPALLGASDYVVLAMPLTAATRGMMGAAEFAAMRPTAVLVNIARGEVVDWEAMRAALRAQQIGAVYTDVTVPEPLPDGDPAWREPNLVITPHNSGNFPRYIDAASEIFAENLRRYLDGAPLRNIVERERGY